MNKPADRIEAFSRKLQDMDAAIRNAGIDTMTYVYVVFQVREEDCSFSFRGAYAAAISAVRAASFSAKLAENASFIVEITPLGIWNRGEQIANVDARNGKVIVTTHQPQILPVEVCYN